MKLFTLLRISGYLAFFDDFGNIDDNYQYYAANSNYNYGSYDGDYGKSFFNLSCFFRKNVIKCQKTLAHIERLPKYTRNFRRRPASVRR